MYVVVTEGVVDISLPSPVEDTYSGGQDLRACC